MYLVQQINPSNRHRITADIKRFVRSLKEKIDEGYGKLYNSFRVKKLKIIHYLQMNCLKRYSNIPQHSIKLSLLYFMKAGYAVVKR